MPSSTNLIRKALHTLGHSHPPDPKRTLQSERRDNGHLYFGKLSSFRYLFIHALLPSSSSEFLIICYKLFGYSVILLCQSSLSSQLPLSRRSMCRYIHGIPPNNRDLSPDSALAPRRFSVMRIHPQLVVAMCCGNVAHTDVPLAHWALVSLDETRPAMVTDSGTCLLLPWFFSLCRTTEGKGLGWEALVIGGSLSLLTRITTSKEDGGMAIAQRSVILASDVSR